MQRRTRSIGAALILLTVIQASAQANPSACERQFLGQQVITTEANHARAVFAADLDGDGDIDVLSASEFDDKIAWYENTDGLGTFGAQRIISTEADGAKSVFAADMDGDGDTDVLSGSFGREIAWYENTDGRGTFGSPQVISNVSRIRSIFAADVDGDGDIDVFSASDPDNKIAWYENTDGLGAFGPQRIITTLADFAISVVGADMDGDGDNDVLTAAAGNDEIAWYENTDGLGTFSSQRLITTAASVPMSVFAADLDGDGDIDVLSASRDGKIAWYQNTDGLGSFGLQRVITAAADDARSVFAADVDGDGDQDVLSASLEDHKIAWYENTDGLGTFGPQRVITTAADGAHSVVAADLDGDGDIDVLSASTNDDKVAWYENETDCNGNGVNDGCDVADGTGADCNENRGLDECDIAGGTSADCDGNGVPDECEPDCNNNAQTDACDLADGTSTDCNANGIPDECDLTAVTSNDCNGNGIPDECDIAVGISVDCNVNGVPDECDLDCNNNGIPDDCDIATGASPDCNANGVPDECEPDCNVNGVQDICDIASGTSGDCNFDLVPDECQPNADCNGNGIRDLCDIGSGVANDCNGNLSPDSCDIASGTSLDANGDGVPDECCNPPAPIFLEPLKSRYLSLASFGAPGVRSAIRVTFGPNAVFPAIEGQSLWVGPPREYPEEDNSNPGRTFVGAGLSCQPHFHDWSTIGVLQVFGAEIVPRSRSQQSLYTVQLINEGCPDSFEVNFSDPLQVPTGVLADMVAPFFSSGLQLQPDWKDIAAVVIKFLGDPVWQNPNWNIKAASQLQPSVVRPANAISFKDINTAIRSFFGQPYVDIVLGAQPCDCPSLVTCGITACVIDSQCAGGVCLDGFCTDACGRCSP